MELDPRHGESRAARIQLEHKDEPDGPVTTRPIMRIDFQMMKDSGASDGGREWCALPTKGIR